MGALASPIITPTDASETERIVTALHHAQAAAPPPSPLEVADVLAVWGARIAESPLMAAPGMVFLTLWLRRGTLLPLLERELGAAAAGGWQIRGTTSTRRLPLGLVGHFPAANVTIQPLLSMACGALGGNASIVRVPSGLDSVVASAIQLLCEVDTSRIIVDRLRLVSIPSHRTDFLEGVACHCDGAMIWGGREAVNAVRSLSFPHWARIATFGPRVSVAVMDCATWSDDDRRSAACSRLARDVWQFDQRACSSPQVLYVQAERGTEIDCLLDSLETAFDAENRAHPRQELEPRAATAIVGRRAGWCLDAPGRSARYPTTPDWTILAGQGVVTEDPVQHKCLVVSMVDDLVEPIRTFNGNVQTVGLACADPEVERAVVAACCRHGVDRMTQLGRMHVFDSPWDGRELVSPMTRLVRYTPTQEFGVAAPLTTACREPIATEAPA